MLRNKEGPFFNPTINYHKYSDISYILEEYNKDCDNIREEIINKIFKLTYSFSIKELNTCVSHHSYNIIFHKEEIHISDIKNIVFLNKLNYFLDEEIKKNNSINGK